MCAGTCPTRWQPRVQEWSRATQFIATTCRVIWLCHSGVQGSRAAFLHGSDSSVSPSLPDVQQEEAGAQHVGLTAGVWTWQLSHSPVRRARATKWTSSRKIKRGSRTGLVREATHCDSWGKSSFAKTSPPVPSVAGLMPGLNWEAHSRPAVLTALGALKESLHNKEMLIACYCTALGCIKHRPAVQSWLQLLLWRLVAGQLTAIPPQVKEDSGEKHFGFTTSVTVWCFHFLRKMGINNIHSLWQSTLRAHERCWGSGECPALPWAPIPLPTPWILNSSRWKQPNIKPFLSQETSAFLHTLFTISSSALFMSLLR